VSKIPKYQEYSATLKKYQYLKTLSNEMLFANYQAAIDQIGLSNIDKGFTEENIRDLFQLKV